MVEDVRKQIKRKKSKYSKVIELRDRWLLDLDRFYEHEKIKPVLIKSSLLEFSKEDRKRLPLKLKEWHKEKFHKYNGIVRELKNLEETDPFGFNEIKDKFKKANPYIFSPTTLKTLLEDIRKKYS